VKKLHKDQNSPRGEWRDNNRGGYGGYRGGNRDYQRDGSKDFRRERNDRP
jgi:hypothetical protein